MRIAGVVCLAAVLLAGCAKPKTGDPRLDLEPVVGFSLGSARFTPFRHRPTVRELHERIAALYGSFGSVAATIESASEGRWESRREYRFVRPSKSLSSTDAGDWGALYVENGRKLLIYDTQSRRFQLHSLKEPMPEAPSDFFSFAGPFRRIRLLPDAEVGGEAVYVMEIQHEVHAPPGGPVFRHTERIYVAKADLLPRKTEDVHEWPGLPRDTETHVYSGVRVNIAIPDELFSTRPPAGSRPDRSAN